jgi:type 1 glutamine amidotransferase
MISAAVKPWGLSLLLCLLAGSLLAADTPGRVLVYTKNEKAGKYVHDNVAASAEAIRKLGAEHGFAVEVSEDANVFTDQNLKRYQAVVFSNVNNEIFDNEEQKAAFQRYIRGGGGFVGVHSATGAMRNWPWYWALVGGEVSPSSQEAHLHDQGQRRHRPLDGASAAHVPMDRRVLLCGPHA